MHAEQVHVFRHSNPAGAAASVAGLERWRPLDESASGFRLQRLETGARVTVGQLLSLRPQGARRFILAEVRWVIQRDANAIELGARALPGLANACIARQVNGDPSQQQARAPALLLPVGSGSPPTLVLPFGWYQRDRVLEIRQADTTRLIRMTDLLDRGLDYERASFCIDKRD